MRKVVLLFLGAGLFAAGVGVGRAASTPRLLHVVLFSLAPDAPPGERTALVAESKRVLAAIPGVEDVRAGAKALDDRDVHVKDYDVGLVVRLTDRAALDVYALHPDHRALVEKHRPYLAKMRVIDFLDE
jgi:hypothetical protein